MGREHKQKSFLILFNILIQKNEEFKLYKVSSFKGDFGGDPIWLRRWFVEAQIWMFKRSVRNTNH